MHRQRIDQFVGKEAASSEVRRSLSGSGEMPDGGVAFRLHHCLFAPQGRALHGDVAKGLIKNRELRLAKIECLRSEPPGTRARLNKHKFRRAAEILPHLHELSRQETGKDRMHVDAWVVVGEALGLRFAVIAWDRMGRD